MTRVSIWVAEGTWPACVEAARRWVPAEAEHLLLHAAGSVEADVAHHAYLGLLGRGGGPAHDPGRELAEQGRAAARRVLDAAAERLGRPAEQRVLEGRVERAVVDASAGGDLLICARDGDRSRLGPHSLGPATRFVVDHAPCEVLLVWPEAAPDIGSIPPAPPRPPRP